MGTPPKWVVDINPHLNDVHQRAPNYNPYLHDFSVSLCIFSLGTGAEMVDVAILLAGV